MVCALPVVKEHFRIPWWARAGKGIVGWVASAPAGNTAEHAAAGPGSPRHRKGGSPRAGHTSSPRAESPSRPAEVRVAVGNKRLMADESIPVPHDVDEYMREKEVGLSMRLPSALA